MRKVFVVTTTDTFEKPLIAFESESDAGQFARSLRPYSDAWKGGVHEVCYVPMSFTDTASEPIFGTDDMDEGVE